MLDPDDPTVRWATFGREVELFLQSDIGDYLVKKAERESDEALQDLKVADPTDARLIQSIQNRIKVADSILSWLGEAIAAGKSAIEQIKGEHDV